MGNVVSLPSPSRLGESVTVRNEQDVRNEDTMLSWELGSSVNVSDPNEFRPPDQPRWVAQ
jgi:hypothetical protein